MASLVRQDRLREATKNIGLAFQMNSAVFPHNMWSFFLHFAIACRFHLDCKNTSLASLYPI